MAERDLSGRPIPTQSRGGAQRFIAVPPIRDKPNDDATEIAADGVFDESWTLLPAK